MKNVDSAEISDNWFCLGWRTKKGEEKIQGFTNVSLNILRVGKLPGVMQLDLFVASSLRAPAFCVCLLVCFLFHFCV